MGRLSNIVFNHFAQPMGLFLIIGILSFSEKHLMITG
jgi:hypothetical protein